MAREQDGNMEINATNGLLADISDLNDDLDTDKETNEVSTPEDYFPPLRKNFPAVREDGPAVRKYHWAKVHSSMINKLPGGNRLDTTPAVPAARRWISGSS